MNGNETKMLDEHEIDEKRNEIISNEFRNLLTLKDVRCSDSFSEEDLKIEF